jgi:cytochrome c biogenesis protein
LPALVSALTALAGLILSFLVRRRRVFVRAAGPANSAGAAGGAAAGPDGTAVADGRATVVEVGGLTRSDAAGGFEVEFAELASEIMQQVRGVAATASSPDGGAVPAAWAKGE